MKLKNKLYTLVVKDYRLFKIIFTLMASYLIFDTFYTFLVLKPTYTFHAKRQLSVEDFPQIILCPEPAVDLTALKARGYSGPDAYFKGQKYGWAGNNSGDVKNVSAEISILKSVKNCGFGGYGYKFELTYALRPNHMCCKVIMTSKTERHTYADCRQTPCRFRFKFRLSKGVRVTSFRVYLADELSASVFHQHKKRGYCQKI